MDNFMFQKLMNAKKRRRTKARRNRSIRRRK